MRARGKLWILIGLNLFKMKLSCLSCLVLYSYKYEHLFYIIYFRWTSIRGDTFLYAWSMSNLCPSEVVLLGIDRWLSRPVQYTTHNHFQFLNDYMDRYKILLTSNCILKITWNLWSIKYTLEIIGRISQRANLGRIFRFPRCFKQTCLIRYPQIIQSQPWTWKLQIVHGKTSGGIQL